MSHWDADGSSVDRRPLRNRVAAGRALARELMASPGAPFDAADTMVLALPRGGVPVAAELARALKVPLDLMVVRKLGHPEQAELAMGALAGGDTRIINPDIAAGVQGRDFERIVAREREELARRERVYRGTRAVPELRGKRVILVDDGVATGASMEAAAQAVRHRGARSITVAVPVAPAECVLRLKGEVDSVVCLSTPEPFGAISLWYEEFGQVSDEEVQAILAACWSDQAAAGLSG